jgi:hypothetical protein
MAVAILFIWIYDKYVSKDLLLAKTIGEALER